MTLGMSHSKADVGPATIAAYGVGSPGYSASGYTAFILFGLLVPTALCFVFHRCVMERRTKILPRILLGFAVLIQVTSFLCGFLAVTIANWFVPRELVSSAAADDMYEPASSMYKYHMKDAVTTSLQKLCYRASAEMPFLTTQCESLCSTDPFVSKFSLRTIVTGRGGCGLLHLGSGLFGLGLILGMVQVAVLFIRSDTLADILAYFSAPEIGTIGMGYMEKLKLNSREGKILRRKLVAQAHVWISGSASLTLAAGLGLMTRWNRFFLGFKFDTSYAFAIATLMTQVIALGLYITRHIVLPGSLREWAATKSSEDDEEEDEDSAEEDPDSSPKRKSRRQNWNIPDLLDLDLETGLPRSSKGGMHKVSDDDDDEDDDYGRNASSRKYRHDASDEEGYTTDYDESYSIYSTSGKGGLDASFAIAISRALGIDEEDSDSDAARSGHKKKGKKSKKSKKKSPKGTASEKSRRGSFLKATSLSQEAKGAPLPTYAPEPIPLSPTTASDPHSLSTGLGEAAAAVAAAMSTLQSLSPKTATAPELAGVVTTPPANPVLYDASKQQQRKGQGEDETDVEFFELETY